MNWYIGQDIVAVRDHSMGRFKRGDEFKIKGLRLSLCKCKVVEIDIGDFDYSYGGIECGICSEVTSYNGVLWFHEKSFAPLDPIKEAISELMEESNVSTNQQLTEI